MDETTAWAVRSTDAELISTTASGDVAAYAMLHERHKPAAQNLAGQLSADPAEVEAIVSAAFAELHGVLRSGGGPTEALRPYLLTVVRGVAHDRQGSDDAEAESPSFADPSASLLGRAFMSLPERWRAAVWLALIEQASAEETAAILGLAADGIAEFTGQARATLADAYLGRYLSGVTRGDCKSATGALGIDSDGTVIVPDEWTAQHLRDCPACRSMVAELGDLSQSLRRVVAPIFLGSAAAAYLSSAELDVTPDGHLPGAPHSMPRVRHQSRQPPHQQRVLVGGGALLGVLAIIGMVLALVPGQHAARRATAEFTAPSTAAPRSASPTPAHSSPTAPPTGHSSNGSLTISPSAQPTTPAPTTAAPVTSPAPQPSPSSVPTFPFPCPSGKICPQ